MIRFLRWKRIGSRKSTLRLPRSFLQNSRPRKAVRLRKLIPPWVNAQASPSRLGISVGDWGTGIVKRSEEHTSELQSLMRISSAVLYLNKNTPHKTHTNSKTKTKNKT